MLDIENTSRAQRRGALKLEREAMRSGKWKPWERIPLPHGIPGARPDGWCADVREVARNWLYVVLIRAIRTDWGFVHHLAIRTASNLEPPWRDKQRIKNELFGPEYVGIEVMPPSSELVDDADMYHMWVWADARRIPFKLER